MLRRAFEQLNNKARDARRRGRRCDDVWSMTAGSEYRGLSGTERLSKVKWAAAELVEKSEVIRRGSWD